MVGSSDIDDWPLIVAGDQAAFGRLFDRHADLLYRFAKRRTGQTSVAEDIMSEAFVQAWGKRETVVLCRGSLRPWLLGVAGNLVRRHWREIERGGRAVDRLGGTLDREARNETHDQLDARNRLDSVFRSLAVMPAEQREIILLAAWERLQYDEIAVVLDIPVGTVRSRLARARQHLREIDGTGSGHWTSLSSSANRSNFKKPEPSSERNPK